MLLVLCLESRAQYVSYWFQGWQRNGNAEDAQAYFMWPGTNVVFTHASNRVIINVSGTITNIALTTNALYSQYATNWLGSTNASNAFWLTLTNAIYNATNGFVAGGQTNIYATNLIGLLEGTNVTFTTNASGYLSINSAGGGTSTNIPPPGPGVSDNLYAWWKFDDFVGIATDSWTNHFDGTLANGPTWITGHIGPGALEFSSPPGNYVVVNTLTNLGFSSGTVTWWAYHTNAFNSSAVRPMWSQWKSSGNELSGYVWSDNNWYLGWNAGGFDQRLSIPATAANYPQNTWMHYAYMWYPTGSAFFTNAVLCASSSTAVTVAQNLNSNLLFGVLKAGSTYYWNGDLDDVRIYNTNLTIAQLQQIYAYSGGQDFYVLKTGDTMSGSLSINGTAGSSPLTVYTFGGESVLDASSNSVVVTNLVVNADVINGPGLILTPPWLASQGGNLLSWTNNDGSVRVINNVRVDQFGNLSTADILVNGTLYANYGFIDVNFGGSGQMAGSTNGILFGDGSGISNVVGTVGITITQYVTDFVLGAITNLYSNGLLVATGPYVAPPSLLLGAGGDAMLGAYGETLDPAG